MTDLLYQSDAYLQEFNARVIEVPDDGRGIILDQTAFYPGGGGQPPDRGEIASGDQVWPMTRIRRIDGQLVHLLAGDAPLPKVGEQVTGRIDWELRYQLMRTHTAMHILCGVVWQNYGAQVTGGNMDPLRGRMDFEFETMQAELVHDIEAAVNAEVTAARPLNVAILPREDAFQIPDLIRTKINLLPEGIREVRTVEIEGLDLQADGGTHVSNTSEVGAIKITDYKSKGKINKRIYLALER
jgi:misacylated tRNA(Ala) deacylase